MSMITQLSARVIKKQYTQAPVIAFSKWKSSKSIMMNLSDEFPDFTAHYSPSRTSILRTVINSVLEHRDKYRSRSCPQMSLVICILHSVRLWRAGEQIIFAVSLLSPVNSVHSLSYSLDDFKSRQRDVACYPAQWPSESVHSYGHQTSL
jgi:hypothetical protein